MVESLTVDGNLESLSAIAKYVMSAASEAGLEKKAIYRLRLAIDEIATNIIVHGYNEANITGSVKVEALISSDRLQIILEDQATPFDPTTKTEPDCLDLPLEQRQIGGLGVFLALDGVDEFEYEFVNSCNRNILTVNLEPKD
jgi:serine/threonine-protein kinase RsbW